MIVYTGHREFDFVYEDKTRGATYGQFIGTIRGCDGTWVLPENWISGGIGRFLDTLNSVESTGLGIDGSGVFHGTPRKSVAEITADAADVFGEYPKNLIKPRKIVPIDGNLRSRSDLIQSIVDLIIRYSSERTRLSLKDGLSRAMSGDVIELVKRYFKEVP